MSCWLQARRADFLCFDLKHRLRGETSQESRNYSRYYSIDVPDLWPVTAFICTYRISTLAWDRIVRCCSNTMVGEALLLHLYSYSEACLHRFHKAIQSEHDRSSTNSKLIATPFKQTPKAQQLKKPFRSYTKSGTEHRQ